LAADLNLAVMMIELINTGAELLLGRVLNSHQQWLGQRLADLGYPLGRQVAVADSARDIEQAVREGLARADLVITTGGLGPTSDDLTRDVIARMLGRKLHEDEAVLAQIRNFFTQLKRRMPASTRAEALVPEGALVLPNANGTAPGLALEVQPNPLRSGGQVSWLVMLPGPPRELRPMFTDSVVPLLQRVLPLKELFVCRTLRSTGIGESVVQEKISGPLQALVQAGLELAYCARPGQVDVRLAARGANAETLVREGETIVQAQLGADLFGQDDEELAAIVVRLLTERGQTLAVAESCTGGCLANQLTNVPGASAVFLSGFITYSNEAKQKFLGVKAATLEQHGAVSEAVACEMAEGARHASRTDYALAVTGIAGPSGGTPQKPVGTVFIALASSDQTLVWRMQNPWDRVTFKEVTTRQALNQLRLRLRKIS
jgi:nicotinamide-nucleotide amidase